MEVEKPEKISEKQDPPEDSDLTKYNYKGP